MKHNPLNRQFCTGAWNLLNQHFGAKFFWVTIYTPGSSRRNLGSMCWYSNITTIDANGSVTHTVHFVDVWLSCIYYITYYWYVTGSVKRVNLERKIIFELEVPCYYTSKKKINLGLSFEHNTEFVNCIDFNKLYWRSCPFYQTLSHNAVYINNTTQCGACIMHFNLLLVSSSLDLRLEHCHSEL